MLDNIKRKLLYMAQLGELTLDVSRSAPSLSDISAADYGSRDPSWDLIRFNPVMSEAEIREVEAKYRVSLPGGYRAFLLEIGNGGEGPGLGFESLQWSLQGQDEIWEPLSQPFPHTDVWIPGPEDDISIIEGDLYWFGPQNLQGTLQISDYGCSYNLRLIITGAERGNIWMEDFGADLGMWPVTTRDVWDVCKPDRNDPLAPHLSFVDWYEAYLDERIKLQLDLIERMKRGQV